MRERLEEMMALVQDNMRKAQKNQKVWYDRKARTRVFEPGQQRGRKHQKFHVNLLKAFQPRSEPVQQKLFVRAVGEEEEASEQYFPTKGQSQTMDLSHLPPAWREELGACMDPELFQEKPGYTTLAQHKIHLKENSPVRQKCYRIPERLLPVLKQELE
ncbi:hypothetical protein SKAU_G00209800 [Synaphobranchus kaupii]|uniref:Uncharacterized protein n=1 Tax=Synaphobranchus kaupii TaxID=118154 RepID=A0A9Q1F940_SYNKA|nr:hypothetical protein SKAU_G00209800 [Synaphobranchus kaupii]